jgi:hypothetical protein
VVLPTLVVLGLVAVVAIASTGSTPSGSGNTRTPSDSFFDTLLTLALIAVVAGGVLLVYGLTQRKAIAREVASGRYPQTSIVAFLVLFAFSMAFSYWRLRSWMRRPFTDAENQELPFPGTKPAPTSSDQQQPAHMWEPSIAWLPIAVVVGLVLAAVVAHAVAQRRARRRQRSKTVLAAELAAVLDQTLDDLRAEADPRRAIIAAYARLERVLAANGVPRRPAETPDEYLPRVLHDLSIDPNAAERLTKLFTRAKFSQHLVDTAMKEEAIGALELVRDELRLAREKQAYEIDSTATPAGAAS